MAKLEKILCAIDFGPLTPKVLDYVKTLTSCLNAKIHLIYVVHSLDVIEQFSVPKSYREEYEKEMISRANEKAREIIKKDFAGKDVEFKIKSGDPAKEILAYINEIGADMVVIGAKNKKDIGEFLFGSVGEKVIKLSKVPVFIVK